VLSFFLLLGSHPARAPAQIRTLHVDAAKVAVTCPSVPGFYYLLLQGESVGTLTSTVDVAVPADPGPVELRHVAAGEATASSGFYAVLEVPQAAPLDADHDGIDDIFETGLSFLDPLDPADAGEDEDEDGVTNYVEYLQGRNLAAGAVAGTAETVGLQVFAPAAW
jgi:hypothetical protein